MLQGKLEKDRRIGDWDVDFIFFADMYYICFTDETQQFKNMEIQDIQAIWTLLVQRYNRMYCK